MKSHDWKLSLSFHVFRSYPSHGPPVSVQRHLFPKAPFFGSMLNSGKRAMWKARWFIHLMIHHLWKQAIFEFPAREGSALHVVLGSFFVFSVFYLFYLLLYNVVLNFCCTMKWMSYMLTYVPSFLSLPPSRSSQSTKLRSLCFIHGCDLCQSQYVIIEYKLSKTSGKWKQTNSSFWQKGPAFLNRC